MSGLKKVAAINDLSGFGKCSLTVTLPIVSSYGIQCCPMPTAILSNHTGYESYFFDDYTDRMEKYYIEWQKLSLDFDCIYTGFLGSEKQIDIVSKFIDAFDKDGTLLLVDPVMGDHGKIYSTYTKAMCEKMKMLAFRADIVTPNLTEACILSSREYRPDMTDCEISSIAAEIYAGGAKCVIITGIHRGENILNYVYNGNIKQFVSQKSVPRQFAGTGDVFASVLCGEILSSSDILTAVQSCADFVYEATKYSYESDCDERGGVDFEHILFNKFKGDGFNAITH